MSEADTIHLIKLALSLDEHGQKREAIKAYGDVVESILKLPETLKAKHKHFAVDALERAEKLKLEINPERRTSLSDIHEPSRITSIPGNSGTNSTSGKKHFF